MVLTQTAFGAQSVMSEEEQEFLFDTFGMSEQFATVNTPVVQTTSQESASQPLAPVSDELATMATMLDGDSLTVPDTMSLLLDMVTEPAVVSGPQADHADQSAPQPLAPMDVTPGLLGMATGSLPVSDVLEPTKPTKR